MADKISLLKQLEEYIKSRELYQQKLDEAEEAEKKHFYSTIIKDKQRNIDRLKDHLVTGKGKSGRRKNYG